MVKRRCFVIMPFSATENHTEEYWKRHFLEFLKPRIEQSGKLNAYRSAALRGNIVNEIITNLVNDPIVVADITDHNPNVFWELGVRQSFLHGTITIAEAGTNIPFDLGSKGTLFYSNTHLIDNEFDEQFQNALTDCLEHPNRPDSLVLEAISGRGTIYEIIKHQETIRQLQALEIELQENLLIITRSKKMGEERTGGELPKTPTLYPRTPATEYILVNRYVMEDENFYSVAKQCFDYTNAMQEQLKFWAYDSTDATTNWVVEKTDIFIDVIEEFLRLVEELLEKLL